MLQRYCSKDDPVFQSDPEHKLPGRRRDNVWTTISGYWRKANKECQLLDLNRRWQRKPYQWAVSINVEHVLVPKEVRNVWTKIKRSLRRSGIVAYGVLEPSCSGHVNAHLIVLSEHAENDLKNTIKKSIPIGIKNHIQIERVKNQWAYCRYVLKAKVSGHVGGKFRSDKYEYKRLLFRPGVRIDKIFTIGSFWHTPKTALWQQIRDREKRIADGMDLPGLRERVNHLVDLVGEEYRRQIERSLAYHAMPYDTITQAAENSDAPDWTLPYKVITNHDTTTQDGSLSMATANDISTLSP